MNEIKISTRYEYRPGESRPCGAKITVGIPVDEDFGIPKLLRSSNETIFGTPLIASWGNREDETPNMRTRSMWVAEATWLEVEEKVQQAREEVVETLERVAAHNSSMMNMIPPAEEVVVYLSRSGVLSRSEE